MTIALADIARCFEGEVPALLATCSPEGEPNLAHLSRVFLVDDQHVATSNQFFTKTVNNLAGNPLATLLCIDPVTVLSFKLLLRHERSEDHGELFDAVRRSIEVIASLTGMAHVFALRAVEVFLVLDVEAVISVGSNADR
ncbi:MAG: pyridoxamine 5'-phosphate oxidase family protein [Actinomycetota bacterium]|nr:pyridoxamine 5'-phosphate oxidase family protein [Actinomycetota bacterium]